MSDLIVPNLHRYFVDCALLDNGQILVGIFKEYDLYGVFAVRIYQGNHFGPFETRATADRYKTAAAAMSAFVETLPISE